MKKYKLGEIADVIGGVNFEPTDIEPNGIRILRGGNIQITMFATRNRSLWLNQTQVNVSTGAVCPLGDAFPRVFFIELGCRFI